MKHCMGAASVKVYDKFSRVLRVETVASPCWTRSAPAVTGAPAGAETMKQPPAAAPAGDAPAAAGDATEVEMRAKMLCKVTSCLRYAGCRLCAARSFGTAARPMPGRLLAVH